MKIVIQLRFYCGSLFGYYYLYEQNYVHMAQGVSCERSLLFVFTRNNSLSILPMRRKGVTFV